MTSGPARYLHPRLDEQPSDQRAAVSRRAYDRRHGHHVGRAVHQQLKVMEKLLEEQRRTNDLLKALVDMRSAELVGQGFQPHPLARR